MTQPAALFDPDGRKKLAEVLVWGGNGHLSRTEIERRIELVLGRMAHAIAPDLYPYPGTLHEMTERVLRRYGI